MQLGTDPWQAAEYLGMSFKTLLENYGHHHPDYLSSPREAFDRPPQGWNQAMPQFVVAQIQFE